MWAARAVQLAEDKDPSNLVRPPVRGGGHNYTVDEAANPIAGGTDALEPIESNEFVGWGGKMEWLTKCLLQAQAFRRGGGCSSVSGWLCCSLVYDVAATGKIGTPVFSPGRRQEASEALERVPWKASVPGQADLAPHDRTAICFEPRQATHLLQRGFPAQLDLVRGVTPEEQLAASISAEVSPTRDAMGERPLSRACSRQGQSHGCHWLDRPWRWGRALGQDGSMGPIRRSQKPLSLSGVARSSPTKARPETSMLPRLGVLVRAW